jgi:hypothetical protein
MQPLGLSQSSKLPDGVNMLIQHTSNPIIASSSIVTGQISKTVVLKNSQPIELKQAFRTVG